MAELIDLDLSGIDAFIAALEVEQRKFNNSITAKYREWVRIIFYDIAELTPQWSGNLAANWNISTDGGEQAEHTIPEKDYLWPLPHGAEPKQRGDAEAVGISKARFDESVFGYHDQVYIYNPTSIAQEVEDQSIYIRGVNLLDGRVAMIAHARSFYSVFSPPL